MTQRLLKLVQFNVLFISVAVFIPLALQAEPPPAPANVQARILPAEVLLTWGDSAGADYYGVYRAELDRRWMPVAIVTTPSYRDTDFRSLPCYYQIAAFNAAGEGAATEEFIVSSAEATVSLIGVTPRSVSDTAFAVAWTIAGDGGADGMLEVGTSPTNYEWVFSTSTFDSRHEFTVTDLAPNTSYFYRLTSAGTNGAGFTYWNSFTTRPFTEPPPAVVRLTDPSPALTTDEDIPVSFTLTADNPGGAPLTYFVTSVPFGTIWGTPPDLVYLSNPEHAGLDYFDCGYTDGVVTNHSRVYVTVRHVEDPPIALDKSVTLAEDTGLKFEVQATGWDFAPATLNCAVVSSSTNGILTREPAPGLVFQYIPNTNFNGIDHFTFYSYDSDSTGNVATVRIRVTPVNDPPIAREQSITVTQGTEVIIVVDAIDPDGDLSLWYTLVSGPSHGIGSGFSQPNDGRFYYKPALGYTGPDSFTYSVTDGSLSASATVNITVVPPNHPPVANDAAVSTEFGVPLALALTGSDPDGDALTFTVISGPAGGALSGTEPSLIYTPAPGFAGNDSFSFKTSDGRLDSAPATVSITVGPSNAPPNAPSNLAATVISRSQINLAWVDNSGRETGFKIERSTDGRNWKNIATVNANVTSYSDRNVSPGKMYSYRMRSFNNFGFSEYSNPASATTPR